MSIFIIAQWTYIYIWVKKLASKRSTINPTKITSLFLYFRNGNGTGGPQLGLQVNRMPAPPATYVDTATGVSVRPRRPIRCGVSVPTLARQMRLQIRRIPTPTVSANVLTERVINR